MDTNNSYLILGLALLALLIVMGALSYLYVFFLTDKDKKDKKK